MSQIEVRVVPGYKWRMALIALVLSGLLYFYLGYLPMILCAPLIIVGTLSVCVNRKKIAEVTFEKSGSVTTYRTQHTLYAIPMQYWGLIGLQSTSDLLPIARSDNFLTV